MAGAVSDKYWVIAPNEEYGVAEVPAEDRPGLRSLSFRLKKPGELQEPIGVRFRSALEEPPDVAWGLRDLRLASPRLREIFTELAGPRDAIQWLGVELEDANHLSRPYL